MTHESSYLTPYQGTEVTALGATYPFCQRINVVPNGADIPPPIVKQERVYDIDAGKHPSYIVNTVQDPVDINLEMDSIFPTFLAYAIGSAATTHGSVRKEVTDITCLAGSAISQGDYFILCGISAAGAVVYNAVWFDIDAAGSDDPDITGVTSIEVDIASDDTNAEVATKLKNKLDAEDNYGASVDGAVVTVTNANYGAVPDARDGAAATGFTFSTTAQGVSTHTVTEEISRSLESFTLHCEQGHTSGSSYDIVYDLFGCVVDTYELEINFSDGIVKEKVGIKCPHFVAGNQLTNPPKKWKNDLYTWADTKESASNYLLMEGTTDRTPAGVNKIVLRINNNVNMESDIATQYKKYAIAGKREVELNIVGFDENRELWDFFKDVWNSANDYYNTASGRLNSKLKLSRDNTYDYFILSVYNWLIEEHNAHFVNVDDAIKNIDVVLVDGTPDSNKRIFDSFSIVNQVSKTDMHNS
jgi:hypothetical protein